MAIQAALLTAEVSIVGAAEAKAALQGIGQQAQQTGEKAKEAGGGLSGMFKNALSFAAGGAIFAGLGFLKDQIGGIFTESMNAQAGLAQTNQVLASTHGIAGVTANAVLDLATQYSHLTQFSDDTVQASENMLLTFTNIGKNVFPQATRTVLDMSQALGQDTKNSAIQLGKALNDPIAGITALQRVGVTFSQTQKDLIKHFMDTNNIAGAQGVILQELQKEFGGSAVAAGKTFGGQLAIAGQRLDDIKQSIGDALMPVLAALLQKIGPIVDAFSQWVASGHAVSDVIAAFNAHASVLIPILVGIGAVLLGGLIAAVWSLAAGVIAATWPFLAIGAAIAGVTAIFLHFYQTNAGFKTFIDMVVNGLKQAASFVMANFIPAMQMIGAFLRNNVLPVLQQVGSFLVSTFKPVWDQLVQTWKNQLLPALQMLWGLFQAILPVLKVVGLVLVGVVVAALAIVVVTVMLVLKALALLIQGFGLLVSFTGAAFSAIGTTITNFKNLIGNTFNAIGTFIHDKIVWIYNHNTYVKAFVDLIVNYFHLLQGIVGTVFATIAAFIGQKLAQAQAFAANFRDALGAIFSQLGSSIQSKISAIGGWIAGTIGGWAHAAYQWGANLIGSFISGIWSMIGGVISAAQSVMNQVANILGFHSPAKEGPGKDADTWAPNLMKMYTQGLTAALPTMQAALNTLMVPVGNTLSGNGPALSTPSASMMGGHGPIVVHVHVNPELSIDGQRLTNKLMPRIAQAIRTSTGAKF